MTVVEFFDKCTIENILSALVCQPEQVVFLGEDAGSMNRGLAAYRQILKRRGSTTQLSCKRVSGNDLPGILAILEKIVREEGGCIFNLNGGGELYLVAGGMIAQKYPEQVKLQRFHLESGTIHERDTDGWTRRTAALEVTAEENALLYGGRLVYDGERAGATYPWEFTADFCRDIRKLWKVCSRNPKGWNLHLSILDKLDSMYPLENQWLIVPMEEARTQIKKRDAREKDFFRLLEELAEEDLLLGYSQDKEVFSFCYKDHQVRRCLTKAGQILELMIAAEAMIAQMDGQPVYHDVATGVYLDWDGRLAEYGADTSNEVDVLLMKGAIPVFISCKNGRVETEELYKLNTVARRFGGKYAKQVLVASELDKMGVKAHHLRRRAKDMGIRILEDVDRMTPYELQKEIAALWK